MVTGFDHSDRVAVVTGGTGALGTAVLPLLVRRNFKIAATYLIPEEAAAIEDLLDLDEDRLMIRRVDCTDADAVGTFMKEAAATFGPVNVLCSLVGGWAGGRFIAESDKLRFDRMIDLNLRSAFNVVRAGIPVMMDADWGRIILMGSNAAVETPAGQAAFNAAKAGVIALAQTAAVELDHTGITANVLLPSVIDTDATRAALPYADYVRWPKTEHIAAVIDFLASAESAVINGAAIPVTGQS
jgi:NAD(P)-dependent dehydrogenase (short-subunit alcohol dehydrogenase family)